MSLQSKSFPDRFAGPVIAAMLLAAASGFIAGPAFAGALLVDWNDTGTDWTPSGSLSQTTNVSDTEDDIDVEWDFSGDTDEFLTSPEVNNRIQGGASANTLDWRFQPDVTTDVITLEISFIDVVSGLGTNVENFSMLVYDIDRHNSNLANSQWTDRLTFTGHLGASAFDPTFSGLGSTVATDGLNALIGTDTNNDSNANGNATISFGGPIDRITIVFQDNVSGNFKADRDHEIGIRQIQFTPVPEPSAAVLVLVAGAIPLLSRRRGGRRAA